MSERYSMADNIRKGVETKRYGVDSEKEVRDKLNTGLSKLMTKFLSNIDSDGVAIDNVADFARVMAMYKEINDIQGKLESNSVGGALPQVSLGQSKVIEKQVEEGKAKVDEEEKLDISDMTEEDIASMILEMDKEKNKENEGAF